MTRAQQYGLSELRELLSLTEAPDSEDHDFEYDRFGDRLVVYLIDSRGVWLSAAGDLSAREFKGLTGFARAELQKSGLTKSNRRIWARPADRPLLPFPFTLQQAILFDQEAGGVITECLDFGEDTEAVFAGLAAKSAELARALVQQTATAYPLVPPLAELRAEHERLKQSGCKSPTMSLAKKHGCSPQNIRKRLSKVSKAPPPNGGPQLDQVWKNPKRPAER